MNRKIIIGFICGCLVSAVLILYLDHQSHLAKTRNENARKVMRLAATTDLCEGEILDESNAGIKHFSLEGLSDHSFEPKDYPTVIGKRLKYPLKKHEQILSFHIKDKASSQEPPYVDPLIQQVYANDDFGFRITIPPHWQPIAPLELEEYNPSTLSNLLHLTYIDPATKEHVGRLAVYREDEEKTIRETTDGMREIRWKNHPCYYDKHTFESGTKIESFMMLKNEILIGFVVGYSPGYHSVTNILDHITIEPDSSL